LATKLPIAEILCHSAHAVVKKLFMPFADRVASAGQHCPAPPDRLHVATITEPK
jgi:hypothetical protein